MEPVVNPLFEIKTTRTKIGEVAFSLQQSPHDWPPRIPEFVKIVRPFFEGLDHERLLAVYDDLARVTFIGHSHLCKAFALSPSDVHEVVATRFTVRENYKYIISVGSVGQPRDYDNRASYTVFDTDDLTFEFKRAEYDIETAARQIFEADLERNFGNRLFLCLSDNFHYIHDGLVYVDSPIVMFQSI